MGLVFGLDSTTYCYAPNVGNSSHVLNRKAVPLVTQVERFILLVWRLSTEGFSFKYHLVAMNGGMFIVFNPFLLLLFF
ncbi:hypothetical protein AB205_0119990 [Aquarana catesbeiana]|uniref:Uncharacterized protein n=1 Tax=Aquarana catesbeiana TaxID=8400 RepID=A0A2G9NK93_AQUCT|nr:hypothetical protein AB205_0119990 [Aquarana catesbeiana]